MSTTPTIEEARAICQRFANQHKIIFDETGECGFGRECVGFRHGDVWISYHPCASRGDYDHIAGFDFGDPYAPEDVDSYHKHECLAVLGRGDVAVIGLARWVTKLEAQGIVSVVQFETGAVGIQALLTGIYGHAIKITLSAT